MAPHEVASLLEAVNEPVQSLVPWRARAGEERAFCLGKVELDEDADALCAATVAANGVETITVAHINLPGAGTGMVGEAAAHS